MASALPGLIPPPVGPDGCALDCSPLGLVAFSSGAVISIIDLGSMQLVHSLQRSDRVDSPVPISALRFKPDGVDRDLAHLSSLSLAAGDKQGRITVWEVVREDASVFLGGDGTAGHTRLAGPVEHIRWVNSKPWMLVSIHAPNVAVVWDLASRAAIWRFESGSEPLVALACDFHDLRRVCVQGGRGLLVSIQVNGPKESDIKQTLLQLPLATDAATAGTTGKDGSSSSAGSSSSGPGGSASLVVCCSFAPHTRDILFVQLAREIVTFDLQFGSAVASTNLPRGNARMVQLLVPPVHDALYCLHADGKLSMWERREGRQLYLLRTVESLVPSAGTPAPLPAVMLAAMRPQAFRTAQKHFSVPSLSQGNASSGHTTSSSKSSGGQKSARILSGLPSDAAGGSGSGVSSCELVSVSEDNKVWHWLATAAPMEAKTAGKGELEEVSEGEGDLEMKLELLGQMHCLSSAVSTLSLPCPSLSATVPGVHSSGSDPSPAVPLVAMAMIDGSIDLLDCEAHSIVASLAVHPAMVRGIRWLGNSRVVSFSFTEVKGGGYENRVVVTCLRSGQSRPFRVMASAEKSPMRGLRASPSGRYLLILFRDAPSEVWAMTRTPQMLRSLALPFTVMEWALPPPLSSQSIPSSSSSPLPLAMPAERRDDSVPTPRSLQAAQEAAESFAFALVNGSLGVFELRGRRVRDFRPRWPVASFVATDVMVTAMAYRMPLVVMGDKAGTVRWWDVSSGESAIFTLSKGGIRRIRFAPSLVEEGSRGRVALMFNDRSFALLDLDSGEFVPNAVANEALMGLQLLEMDWLPCQTLTCVGPEANAQLLCAAVTDGSIRILEMNTTLPLRAPRPPLFRLPVWKRPRPSPFASVALMPTAHALALRLLLQLGVRDSWLQPPPPPSLHDLDDDAPSSFLDDEVHSTDAPPLPSSGTVGGISKGGDAERDEQEGSSKGHGRQQQQQQPPPPSAWSDLRSHLLGDRFQFVGEAGVPEVLLKAVDPMRGRGCLLDVDSAVAYVAISSHGFAARCSFAAAHFGDHSEAQFWRLLPHALKLLAEGSAGPSAFWRKPSPEAERGGGSDGATAEAGVTAGGRGGSGDEREMAAGSAEKNSSGEVKVESEGVTVGQLEKTSEAAGQDLEDAHTRRGVASNLQPHRKILSPEIEVWGDVADVRAAAHERIKWHTKVNGQEAAENRVHEFVAIGDYESAVTMLLATPWESPLFFSDALRAVALAAAVSPAMKEVAAKVIATNMVLAKQPIAASHLLCSVGRYAEACSQLQDVGRWVDASVMASSHLDGEERAKVLHRWALHTLHEEKDLWRAMSLFVASGNLKAALVALREAHQADTAMMFLLACHEIHSALKEDQLDLTDNANGQKTQESWASLDDLELPGNLAEKGEEVNVVGGLFRQYQRWLAHLCTPADYD